MTVAKAYDAVVVGAGPNGLACAITLAQAGFSVAVFEKSKVAGGGAKTEELTLPGFRHDVCSAVHPLGAASPFFRSLPLEEFGMKWIHSPNEVAHPLDEGRAAILNNSVEVTASGLGVDKAAYTHFFQGMANDHEAIMKEILAPTFHMPQHFLKLTRFGLVALLSAQSFARRFSGEEARALWLGISSHSAGSPAAMASAAPGLALQVAGHGFGWPFPEGGSASLTHALVSYLKKMGGEIFTEIEVKDLRELPDSRAVFLDLTPRQILNIAAGSLSAKVIKSFSEFRYGAGVFKLDWALEKPIPWVNSQVATAATVHLGGSFDEIFSWEQNISERKVLGTPFVLLTQPSLFDQTRAPRGKHVAWAYCHVPSGATEDFTELIERQIERFAPGFKKIVLARSRLFPRDFEKRNPNLIGGDISGGMVSARQLFFRPRFTLDPYALDGKKLWICSSSTPPGPGVHGMCGHNAAIRAMAHLRSKVIFS